MTDLDRATSAIGCRRKVMAIGLDGLTWDVLQPLIARGDLPTFRRLVGEGATGVLRSVTNMTTGPTWTTFATGCFPARHGVLNDYHHRAESYALRRTTGADVRLPTLWRMAGDARRRSIVLNVPETYPAEPLDGVLLAGIDAPGETAPGFDYPPGTFEGMRRQVPGYVIDCAFTSYVGRDGVTTDVRRLALGVAAVKHETEARTRAAEHLLAQEPWDLLVVVYSLPDIWQHFFWPHGGSGKRPHEVDLVCEAHRVIDGHLARLVRQLPPDGVAVLFSDHGFGPAPGCLDALNRRLAEAGLLRFHEGERNRLQTAMFSAVLRYARRRLSYDARQRLLTTIPGLKQAVDTRLNIGRIDWSRTRAYGAVDHSEVWLNIRGRQPNGIVDPAERDRAAESVRRALLSWHDDVTGRPRVLDVSAHADRDAAIPDCVPPDLLVTWDHDAAPARANPGMSGDHAPDGVLIVAGGGIAPGPVGPSSLVDVAPIVLAALGAPIPSHIDGRLPPSFTVLKEP